MTKLELISELEDYHHAFLSPEGAEHFLKPFGLKAHIRVAKANPNSFKGLTLNNGMAEAEGMDGLSVVSMIAEHYKLNVPDFFGRGSQHRAYCEAIKKHLTDNQITD